MSAFWRGRRVLVTGHTGFKGAWLCLWLEHLGAQVAGFALPPETTPSLYALISPWSGQQHVFGDIRDRPAISAAMAAARPEIVVHMAAQPLVRAAYRDPVGTFEINVTGSLNVLEAVRSVGTVRAVVAVTTDKVYRNEDLGKPFVESDPLGGGDPYSASKAAMEIAVASYRDSFFSEPGAPAMATARAGNVIGGGDWNEDRLVPDVVRALEKGQPVELRYPSAVRPWQHVLDPLAGYLALAERLATAPKDAPLALNFGPEKTEYLSVTEVVEALSGALGAGRGWIASPGPHPPEADVLRLDASAARAALGWRSRLSIAETINWTADWYGGWKAGKSAHSLTLDQIACYEALSASGY